MLESPKNYQFNVAHLDVTLNPRDVSSRFFREASRFHFNIGPVFEDTTKFLKVKCGKPKCGVAVSGDRNPFSQFGANHQTTVPQTEGMNFVRFLVHGLRTFQKLSFFF